MLLPEPGSPAIRTIMIGKDYRKENYCWASFVEHIGRNWNRIGHRSLGRRLFDRRQLRFAPLSIATRHRDVKYPLTTLFFRLDQSGIFERHDVLFPSTSLAPGHAPALNVDRNARQMGRSCLARLRRRIAIVTAQLFLYQYGSHRRIYLTDEKCEIPDSKLR